MEARRYLIAVELLDHQVVDTDGRMAGNVDDLEITIGIDGRAELTALLSGPGVLAERLGHSRYGRWRQRAEELLDSDERTSRVPWRDVRAVDTAVRVNRRADQLSSFGTERWFRDHVIRHLPGARGGS